MPACHPWAADLQTKCLRAEAVATLLESLKGEGLQPDLVIGHPGWGELLAVKDIVPDVPVLHQVEFVYQLEGADTGFDPEFAVPGWRERARLRLRRAPQLLAFHDLDWGLAPTAWQASTVPPAFRERVSVIHEGIDTDRIAPASGCRDPPGEGGPHLPAGGRGGEFRGAPTGALPGLPPLPADAAAGCSGCDPRPMW